MQLKYISSRKIEDNAEEHVAGNMSDVTKEQQKFKETLKKKNWKTLDGVLTPFLEACREKKGISSNLKMGKKEQSLTINKGYTHSMSLKDTLERGIE